MSNEITPPPGEPTPASGDSPGQTPTPPSQTASGGSQQTPITSLPADIQDYIARLREEAEAANKAKRAEAKAKQAAEEQRLKEQGEFKALAEQYAARVRELEPIVEREARLAKLEHARIDALVKEWPEEVRHLVPNKETDADTRLARVEELRPLVDKLTQQRTPAPGNRAGPPAVGNPGDMNRDVAKTELLKSGLYKGF